MYTTMLCATFRKDASTKKNVPDKWDLRWILDRLSIFFHCYQIILPRFWYAELMSVTIIETDLIIFVRPSFICKKEVIFFFLWSMNFSVPVWYCVFQDRVTFRRIVLKNAFNKRKIYESLLESVPMLKTLDVSTQSFSFILFLLSVSPFLVTLAIFDFDSIKAKLKNLVIHVWIIRFPLSSVYVKVKQFNDDIPYKLAIVVDIS